MFEQTSEELLAEIADIVEVVDHDKGQTIFAKGDVVMLCERLRVTSAAGGRSTVP